MASAKSPKMPSFTKTPAAVVERFNAAIERLPGVEPRKMFGYPSGFVNGNLFTGIFQDRIMVRLSESDRAALLAIPGAKPFSPMPGRPMKEYVELPKTIAESPRELAGWVARALEYGKTLPSKTAKAKTAKKKTKS